MAADSSLVEKLLAGNRGAIAKAISMVENDHRDALDLLKKVHSSTGKAYRVGITGPPGAGKSTIANKLAKRYRDSSLRVGILAVDPTSPFTGGALLGDRVRMTDVELDDGVFIRSMASRGSLGGLSKKAAESADILDAAGCDIVLLETVGVGQSELDIAGAADTTVVVLVPESGDSIQAMKAGLMEIADVFVVNKSDRAGSDQAIMAIKTVLNFKTAGDGWSVDVLKCVAKDGEGIDRIATLIERHRKFLHTGNRLKKKRGERARARVYELVAERLRDAFWGPEKKKLLDRNLEAIVGLSMSPYECADLLLKNRRK